MEIWDSNTLEKGRDEFYNILKRIAYKIGL